MGHDFDGSTIYVSGKNDGGIEQHWKKCSRCSVQDTDNKEVCTGGTATTTQKAICSTCGNAYGQLLVGDIDLSKYVILRSNRAYGGGNNQVIVNNASSTLKDIIMEATGLSSMIIYDDNNYQYYGSKPNFISIDCVYDRPEGGLTGNISAELVARAKELGDQAYIITIDAKGNIYICGATPAGTFNGVNAFLKMMFGFEQFGIGNYTVDQVATGGNYKFDMSKLREEIVYSPTIKYRSTGYSGVIEQNGTNLVDGYRMNYASQFGVDQMMFLKDGDWSVAKNHNALSWLPYETYGSSYPNWYNGQSDSDLDLCYTAHGVAADYQAMIEAVKERIKEFVALPSNADKTVLMLGKQDETPPCECSACKALVSSNGGYSATMVKFFNDVMALVEADASIARTDFVISFLAYTEFETAPTGMTLHQRVVPMLALAYAFNYQADIMHSTNDAGRANIEAWANMSSQLFLWTYSAKFNNYMYPVDTFAFYNENAYRYFAQNKVTMITTQGSYDQTGTQTAWGNLKMYLESQLSWDATQTQAELITKYMDHMFGPAASIMTEFFNSVRTACQRSTLMDAYAECKHPYTILGNELELDKMSGLFGTSSKYWEKNTVKSWIDYCENAYTAIAHLETENPTLYAKYKANIDAEWISPAFMYLDMWGTYSTATKDNFKAKYTALGMTQCREKYPNVTYLLSEKVNQSSFG